MSQSGFINEKEGKLAYQVSAGGRNLSGGQRQRLCIARCFAKNSPIIILDDSASALDFATEKSLRQAIASIKDNKIIFIVSQRIGSIMNADKIVVMEKGSVAGIGTHDELMESCDVYREIYTSQVDEKEVAS